MPDYSYKPSCAGGEAYRDRNVPDQTLIVRSTTLKAPARYEEGNA